MQFKDTSLARLKLIHSHYFITAATAFGQDHDYVLTVVWNVFILFKFTQLTSSTSPFYKHSFGVTI